MRGHQETWAFDSNDLQHIDALLNAYLQETEGRYVLLVDRVGQTLASAGNAGGIDIVSFASLAAADFAASGQLARLLGEDDFASLYHQADGNGMFLVDVAGRAILAVLVGERTTLGLLRLKAREVVPRLATLFTDMTARSGGTGPGFEAGWLSEAESQIDRLFGA